jgi:hypothetical protein
VRSSPIDLVLVSIISILSYPLSALSPEIL